MSIPSKSGTLIIERNPDRETAEFKKAGRCGREEKTAGDGRTQKGPQKKAVRSRRG